MEIKKILKKIPQSPGIYMFLKGNNPLYIGKAKNLKKRLASYKNSNSLKIKSLLQEATKLKYIVLKNELLAFLKEAEYIKKYQPKYNIILRDDRNYFYVAISKEKINKVFITHKTNLKNFDYFGPFIEGKTLKIILKSIRKIFQFCNCKENHLRECINAQMNLCPGWCCIKNSKIEKDEILKYKKNIKAIKLFLKGKIEKARELATSKEEFDLLIEKIKDLIEKSFIFENEKLELNFYDIKAIEDLKNLLKIKKIERIEAYDISHWNMNFPYGVMIVWENKNNIFGFNKNEYRVFKIKTIKKPDDPKMIKEVLERRLKHKEWQFPDLILIDGGKVQLEKAKEVASKFDIKVISIGKGKMELYFNNKKIKIENLPFNLSNLILKINKESHRFAISFHRKIRQKSFLV
jgi:excinuclease ABC subunit C